MSARSLPYTMPKVLSLVLVVTTVPALAVEATRAVADARDQAHPLITVDQPASAKVTRTAARPSATQPAAATMPAESDGSVGRALTKLYRIPRPDRTAAPVRGPGYVVRPGKPATGSPSASPTVKPKAPTQRPTARQVNGQAAPVEVAPGSPNGYAWDPSAGGAYYGPVYGGARLASDKRDWVDYRYFDGQPSRYGYGDRSWYGVGDNPQGGYYRFGFVDGYQRGQWDRENDEYRQSVLSHAGIQMSRGLQAFRSGAYREAVKWFKLASEMNQGDPSAMIYSAHALFSIGRYQEGSVYLHKAFTLEPRIAMLTYDIRDDYGNPAHFQAQLAALESAVAASPGSADRLLVLGYVLNYTGQPDRAYTILARARRLDPRDRVIKALYDATNPPDAR